MPKPDSMHFTKSILSWHDSDPDRRPMPWRGIKDPYAIWLSEVILQQTRVEQGWKYYERFIQAYPKVEDLANASEDEVLAQWKGLGYYSRARNLHATAKKVSDELKGEFPKKKAELLKLKGVGDYTASAIASFAFNEPNAVLDGNVIRILARYFGIEGDIRDTKTKKELQNLADSLIAVDRPAEYNQAIMDFGSMQCTPQKPNCTQCPLSESCYAFAEGKVSSLPFKSKPKEKVHRYFHFILLPSPSGGFWLQKRTAKDIWQNLYQPLLVESDKILSPNGLINEMDQDQRSGLGIEELEIYPKAYKQTLSHQIIHARFYQSPSLIKKMDADTEWRELRRENLDTFALPKVVDCYFLDDWLNLE